MSLLLHAIVAAEPVAVEAPLVRVDAGTLSAIASPTEVAMLEHHTIVEKAHAIFSACLPARYPTWIDNSQALRERLERREVDLLKALERVRGKAELAVTATWTTSQHEDPPLAESTPGRRYLLQRQREFAHADAQRRRATEVAEQLEATLAALAVETQRSLTPRPGVAVSLALLVQQHAIDKVKAAAQNLDEPQDVRILVSGPWPPYSFARLGMGEE
jgi:hypothetical protein